MREILFRGKKMSDGRWAYGDYHRFFCTTSSTIPTPTHYIMGIDASSKTPIWVDPATVGQYSDLTDKNGAMIFEGDIVRVIAKDTGFEYIFEVKFGNCGGTKNVDHPVGFVGFYFYPITSSRWEMTSLRRDPIYYLTSQICDVDVIGNVYDNKELLEAIEDGEYDE